MLVPIKYLIIIFFLLLSCSKEEKKISVIEEKNLGKELFPLLEKINNDMSLLDQIKTKQSQYSDKLVFRNIDKV